MRAGYYDGPDQTYTGIWFNDAGSPGSTNFGFLGNQTYTYVNAPTGGVLQLSVGSAYAIGITGSSTMSMVSNINITSFNIGMTPQTSDAATGNLTLSAQAPYSGAATHVQAGDVIVNIPANISGTLYGGGLYVEYAGVNPLVRLGTYSNGSFGSIWFGSAASAPSSTNFGLLGDGTNTQLNAAPGHSVFIEIAGSPYFTLQSGFLKLGTFGAETYQFDWSTNAVFHFTTNATGSANIVYDAQTTDVATHNLTILGQYAYSGASGTNRVSGNVIIDVGPPASAVVSEAFFQVTRGGSPISQIGVVGSSTSLVNLWLGTGSFSTNTWTLQTDGTSILNVNAPSSGSLRLCVGASVYSAMSSTDFYFGSTGTSSPLYVDWTTSTTPFIRSGTAATQLTIGTGKSNASTILQGDNATTILTLTTSAEFATYVKYDNVSTPSTPAGGPVLFGSSGALKAVGTSGTISTVAPADLEGFGGHCPVCGTDFAHEWSNDKYGSLTVCMKCLTDELGERPWIVRKGAK